MKPDDIRLAAITLEEGVAVDPLFDTIVATLRDEGWQVAGYVQREIPNELGCSPEMLVEDVESGERLCISQALGPGSAGCRLDPQALANVAGLALVRLDERPDLLVLNRFGKGESEGMGLRAVIEKAASLNIPVLTSVKDTYRSAWMDYAGELSAILPASADAALAWCRAAITAQRTPIHHAT